MRGRLTYAGEIRHQGRERAGVAHGGQRVRPGGCRARREIRAGADGR